LAVLTDPDIEPVARAYCCNGWNGCRNEKVGSPCHALDYADDLRAALAASPLLRDALAELSRMQEAFHRCIVATGTESEYADSAVEAARAILDRARKAGVLT